MDEKVTKLWSSNFTMIMHNVPQMFWAQECLTYPQCKSLMWRRESPRMSLMSLRMIGPSIHHFTNKSAPRISGNSQGVSHKGSQIRILPILKVSLHRVSHLHPSLFLCPNIPEGLQEELHLSLQTRPPLSSTVTAPARGLLSPRASHQMSNWALPSLGGWWGLHWLELLGYQSCRMVWRKMRSNLSFSSIGEWSSRAVWALVFYIELVNSSFNFY